MGRSLRDWTDSKRVNSLTWSEEVLFVRLIMKADDYGNYYADSSLIKAYLYPRKDGIRTTDIDGWLTKLEVAHLIRSYSSKGDSFLHIVGYGQKMKHPKRIFPVAPDFSQTLPEVEDEIETEDEVEDESEGAFTIEFLKESFNSKFNYAICRDFKISEEKNSAKKEEFFNEIERTEEYLNYKTVQKCKFHYNHWLKKQLEKENGTTGKNKQESAITDFVTK